MSRRSSRSSAVPTLSLSDNGDFEDTDSRRRRRSRRSQSPTLSRSSSMGRGRGRGRGGREVEIISIGEFVEEEEDSPVAVPTTTTIDLSSKQSALAARKRARPPTRSSSSMSGTSPNTTKGAPPVKKRRTVGAKSGTEVTKETPVNVVSSRKMKGLVKKGAQVVSTPSGRNKTKEETPSSRSRRLKKNKVDRAKAAAEIMSIGDFGGEDISLDEGVEWDDPNDGSSSESDDSVVEVLSKKRSNSNANKHPSATKSTTTTALTIKAKGGAKTTATKSKAKPKPKPKAKPKTKKKKTPTAKDSIDNSGILSVGNFTKESATGALDLDEEMDFDDIDWDDEGAQHTVPQTQASVAPDGAIHITMDRAHTDIKEEEAKKKPTLKRKRAAPRMTAEQKQLRISLHHAHLVALIASCSTLSERADSHFLQAVLLSVVPSLHLPMCTRGVGRAKSKFTNPKHFTKWLKGLMIWWNSNFQLSSVPASSLLQALKHRNGSIIQNVQLFVALCRAMTLSVRIVCALNPSPIRGSAIEIRGDSSSPILLTDDDLPSPPPAHKKRKVEEALPEVDNKKQKSPKLTPEQKEAAKRRVFQLKKEKKVKARLNQMIVNEPDTALAEAISPKLSKKSKEFSRARASVVKAQRASDGGKFRIWVEIFSVPFDRWISVDIVNNVIDKPHSVISAKEKWGYILSFESSRCIRDVTARYVDRYSLSLLERSPKPHHDYLSTTLSTLSRDIPTNLLMDRAEDKELTGMIEGERLPTSITAFQKHHLYVLEKHLLTYQIIYPTDVKPVGAFNALPVFSRKNVADLHTEERWLQEGKQLMVNQAPAKQLPRRLSGVRKKRLQEMRERGEGDGEGGEGPPMSDYYGAWQVEDYKPGEVVNGEIPKNRYGNVWLYKDKMLPKGATVIHLENVNKICRKLKIDCAQAMIGWHHGRYPRPILDGWVVPTESVQKVTAAWILYQSELLKEEVEKRVKRARTLWLRFTRGLMMKKKLLTKTSHFSEQISRVEGGPKKKPTKKATKKPAAKSSKTADKNKNNEKGGKQCNENDTKKEKKKKTQKKRKDMGPGHVHSFTHSEVDGKTVRVCECGLELFSETL